MNNNKINDAQIKELLEKLGSDDTASRTAAREKLTSMGDKAIDYLMELIDHPKHIYRWEALQTLKDINSPKAIPVFLEALEDDESDLRWIAAEGLINQGEKSVRPLLARLVENSDSVFLLSGAHHVFYDLKKNDALPEELPVDEILAATKRHELKKGIKAIAYNIINETDGDV